MPDLPLPGLTPGDPENKLSYEARQRIGRAFLEYNLIRKRALSAIDLGGYWNTPQEHAEMKKAALEAIRVVLRVETEEYAKLGLSGREFREIIGAKIEEAVYSLGFSHVQRDVLEAEFLWSSQRERPAPVAPADVSPEEKNPDSAEHSAGKQVRDFMASEDLDISAFADMIHRSQRTVGSVLADVPVGNRTKAAVAKVLGTTPEELFRK
jgi:hypothetical protein